MKLTPDQLAISGFAKSFTIRQERNCRELETTVFSYLVELNLGAYWPMKIDDPLQGFQSFFCRMPPKKCY